MNTGTNAAVNTPRSKEDLEQRTGDINSGQLAMEKDLGLDPAVNLPARPEQRRPRAHPDNSACSFMEHQEHKRQ